MEKIGKCWRSIRVFLIGAILFCSLLPAAIEPGFKDRLQIYPKSMALDADTSIKDLSRRFDAPISIETGEGPLLGDSTGITLRLPESPSAPVQVIVGDGLVRRGLIRPGDRERLQQVVSAYSKEALAESALYGAIQFLSNTFEARVSGEEESGGWQRLTLNFLVFSFVGIALLVFFLESPTSPKHSTFHHPF